MAPSGRLTSRVTTARRNCTTSNESVRGSWVPSNRVRPNARIGRTTRAIPVTSTAMTSATRTVMKCERHADIFGVDFERSVELSKY